MWTTGKRFNVFSSISVGPKKCASLEGDDTRIIKWWVDVAFAVHLDMCSQTGATMSLGKGSIYSSSLQQKLNT
jgi:hypothetical protein